MRHGIEFGLEVGKLRAALPRARRIPALRHEAVDHAVEHHPVVEARTGQGLDPLDMARRPVGLQTDLDPLPVRQVEDPDVVGISGDIIVDRRIAPQRLGASSVSGFSALSPKATGGVSSLRFWAKADCGAASRASAARARANLAVIMVPSGFPQACSPARLTLQ